MKMTKKILFQRKRHAFAAIKVAALMDARAFYSGPITDFSGQPRKIQPKDLLQPFEAQADKQLRLIKKAYNVVINLRIQPDHRPNALHKHFYNAYDEVMAIPDEKVTYSINKFVKMTNITVMNLGQALTLWDLNAREFLND